MSDTYLNLKLRYVQFGCPLALLGTFRSNVFNGQSPSSQDVHLLHPIRSASLGVHLDALP